jgi:hypothetical protein
MLRFRTAVNPVRFRTEALYGTWVCWCGRHPVKVDSAGSIPVGSAIFYLTNAQSIVYYEHERTISIPIRQITRQGRETAADDARRLPPLRFERTWVG